MGGEREEGMSRRCERRCERVGGEVVRGRRGERVGGEGGEREERVE